ncbi:MAG: hypothetical protein ACR2FY_09715 [Pirellulaceae bacterium]
MSIGSLGIVGSLAGTALVQKSADVDKTQRDAADAARKTEATARAESAEGIGQTEEESQAEERDADGRRLWERQAKKPTEEEEAAASTAAAALAKDPEGVSGGTLDLTG